MFRVQAGAVAEDARLADVADLHCKERYDPFVPPDRLPAPIHAKLSRKADGTGL